MSHVKDSKPDFPVHEFVAARWSPYSFADRDISKEDLQSLFEAARWAPSAYNEQPWRYIVATRDNKEEFEKLLSCLVDGNIAWARLVPALALGVINTQFTHNGKPNDLAMHDLGLASSSLLFEATARGIAVHQMSGILPDKAREVYGIPREYRVITAIAMGYHGERAALADDIRSRDNNPRSRRPLAEFLFAGSWGKPSAITK